MRGGQKEAAREWSLIATTLAVIIIGSASAGYLLLRLLEAWGWVAW